MITIFSGTGKSTVIRAMSLWSESILLKQGDHPHKPRVLLLAPTGKAASLIGKFTFDNTIIYCKIVNSIIFLGGITLHSAFDFKFGNEHVPLNDKKLAEFRNNLSDLKLIIIDEMSLLNADMLYRIHLRLCEIFQSKEMFANISIIAVGDLLQVINSHFIIYS